MAFTTRVASSGSRATVPRDLLTLDESDLGISWVLDEPMQRVVEPATAVDAGEAVEHRRAFVEPALLDVGGHGGVVGT